MVLVAHLYLVLTLDKQVQHLLCVHYSLSEVGHQANQCCVPLVSNLSEGCATTVVIALVITEMK
jgi:hypothetical protein